MQRSEYAPIHIVSHAIHTTRLSVNHRLELRSALWIVASKPNFDQAARCVKTDFAARHGLLLRRAFAHQLSDAPGDARIVFLEKAHLRQVWTSGVRNPFDARRDVPQRLQRPSQPLSSSALTFIKDLNVDAVHDGGLRGWWAARRRGFEYHRWWRGYWWRQHH